MPALTSSERISIITARTLARADTRAEYLDALSLCESPTICGQDPASLDLGMIHAAALGTLSAQAAELCAMVERLAAELDAREAETEGTSPPPVWAIWRVDENIGMSREIGQQARPEAEQTVKQLMADRRPPGVHFMAMPLGGCPFDVPDSIRKAGALS